ncbi:MAG: phosphoglucomutase/phosphomannomutase family protein [Bacillota bacterium]|nr:phosphoglucomutase/phosphomannomutase family protein [Bacillota bacterium]
MSARLSSPLKFGTDGWRAVIAQDFTFANVRRVAQALADYVVSTGEGSRGLVVGYDTRFLSDRFAASVAEVLAANGVPVYLTDQAAPTPAVSYAIKHLGAAGGVMVTASHNPPEYNGIKFKGSYGGSALPGMVAEIESRLETAAGGEAPRVTANRVSGCIRSFDPRPPYFAQLRKLVDFEAIRSAGLRLVVDPMHGAGRGYLKELLAEERISVTEIRGEFNPSFGGVNPEPIACNLDVLAQAVRESRGDLGVATDGDADRVGAMDERGNFVDSHRIFALLLEHLVSRRRWTGAVVKTFSTTQMIDKLAAAYGLTLYETPIGFKYVCEYMLADDILIGGEESGGIGIKNHLPERDGLLCSLLLAESLAVSGLSLAALVDDLLRRVGQHEYGRVDLHLRPGQKEAVLERLMACPPRELAGQPVVERRDRDGLKFVMADGSWLLFRPSGTEPLLRTYAEAPSREQVRGLLAFAVAEAES